MKNHERWLALGCTIASLLGPSAQATELKQKTIKAFEHYVRVTDSRIEAELRPGGALLWLDSLPEPQRQKLYKRVRHGQLEIRQERTEEEGKLIEIPDGSIHHWAGVMFVPGASLKQALSLLQDYDNQWHTYKLDVRRSKLLEPYRQHLQNLSAVLQGVPTTRIVQYRVRSSLHPD